MINNILIIFLTFLITIIIGYFFGLTIVNIIDNRINKLNLNSYIESFNNNEKKELTNSIENSTTKKIEISNSKSYNNSTGEKINPKYNFDNDYYKSMNSQEVVEGYSDNPDTSFKSWSIEKKNVQVCFKNHIHKKDGKDLNCNYGLTNYADPYDMSPIDYKIFNLNYAPNMTLQDYVNWLYCFLDKEDQLPYNHLKNLEKIKSGKELILEDGILPPPAYYYPALNAKDYFDKMYNDVNEFNIAGPLNSNTGPMVGYNYNEYSEFSQNADLYGSGGSIRNKNIDKKKNAKKLHNYVDSKDSNYLNETKEYDIYRIKNVEV